ncbi:hypothetical protein CDD82_3031 [Ophiocordyceps australis]|uniref:Uncharacterized protein n=1 Tax=Ophiocordyceps australis TaxID=1399860 RepID=A0A2C5YK74_9HYPO|nr:hypothetical protein CDD82_3031 [Ophiocordyceps australis]
MDQLPLYSESHGPSSCQVPDNTAENESQLLPPGMLYLAGRFIHSNKPQAPPLYELSHSVGFLGDSDRLVRIERLDHFVKHHSGAPHVSTRSRHLYNLEHPTMIASPTLQFLADKTSRQSLCSFAIVAFRPSRLSSSTGHRIHRIARGPHRQFICHDILFTAMPAKGDAVTIEWFDSCHLLIARETDSGHLPSLFVSAELEASTRDALVSAWVLRIWMEQTSNRNKWDRRIDEAKRIVMP